MFYFITSKLPIISLSDESRLIKIFIIGTIIYIILHAYLFSNSNKDSEYIVKYGKYMYYLWGADLALLGLTNNSKSTQNIDESDEEPNNNREQELSKEEIASRLSSIQSNVEQAPNFPFIRRDAKQSSEQVNEPLVKETNISDTEILLYKK